MNLRGLPVPQQAFLLLQLLDLLFVVGLIYQLIDRPKVTFCRYFEAGVFLSDSIASEKMSGS